MREVVLIECRYCDNIVVVVAMSVLHIRLAMTR